MSFRFGRLVLLAPVLGLLVLAVAPAPTPAQQLEAGSGLTAAAEPGAEVVPGSEQQLRELIESLKDPERRARLIADLEALLAAKAEAPDAETPEDVVGWTLGEISSWTAVIRDIAQSVADSLGEAPELLVWLEEQIRDPATRAVWISVGVRVVAVLGIGALAHVTIGLALRGVRGRLTSGAPAGPLEFILRLIAWIVVEVLPIGGFALAAYATMAALRVEDIAGLVVLPFVMAVLIVRGGIVAARILFAPKAPALRFLPLGHDMAHFAMRWSRRLLGFSVYGYFILEAGRQLGLPAVLHGILLHVLFFVVTVMVMTVIVQIREPVSAALASLRSEAYGPAVRRLPWATLASTWHVLALLYVAFIYLVWALNVPGGFRALIEATAGSAGIVIAGWLLWRFLDSLLPSGEEEAARETQDLLPGFERRASRYRPAIRGLGRTVLLLFVGLGLLEVWGFGTLTWLFSDAGSDVVGSVLTVAVVVAITVGIWELISLMIERSITETDAEGNPKLSNRTRTLLNITRNFLLVFLALIAIFLILSELGLNVAPLLAGAGVIGLAIGFGSQKLVQDIITGLFMLLGDTIRVGDVVEVGGRAGVVEQVTMRTVALRDLAGNVHTIPYSAIDTIMNYTKDYSYALLDIAVAYRENIDEVIQVLRDVGAEMNRDPGYRRNILEPLEILGVDAFAESGVVIKLRFKTRPLFQWVIAREFRRRVKNRFDQLGIEIPYPHRTIYFGADKQNQAMPARVRIEEQLEPLSRGSVADVEKEEAPQPVLAQSRGG